MDSSEHPVEFEDEVSQKFSQNTGAQNIFMKKTTSRKRNSLLLTIGAIILIVVAVCIGSYESYQNYQTRKQQIDRMNAMEQVNMSQFRQNNQ